jgi:hypothetical protein
MKWMVVCSLRTRPAERDEVRTPWPVSRLRMGGVKQIQNGVQVLEDYFSLVMESIGTTCFRISGTGIGEQAGERLLQKGFGRSLKSLVPI